jgi:uncharacterized protein (TIGR02147 family)
MKNDVILDIYEYSNIRDYLNSYYNLKKQGSYGHFNLNSWSKKLGYNSPRVIAMVMKGQRAPSEEMVDKLGDYFNFSGSKTKYLKLLRKKAALELKSLPYKDIEQQLIKFNPHKLNLKPVHPDQFKLISEWHNLVIKQLVKVRNFKNDLNWIEKKLKRKVSTAKIKKSIDLLLKLGHLKKINNNQLCISESVKVGANIPSSAIKSHHEQMLDRAKESLYQDELDERFIYGITMNFNRNDMPEAKKMIQEFLNEFDAHFSAENNKADDIYQIGVQLFPHTKEERILQ